MCRSLDKLGITGEISDQDDRGKNPALTLNECLSGRFNKNFIKTADCLKVERLLQKVVICLRIVSKVADVV